MALNVQSCTERRVIFSPFVFLLNMNEVIMGEDKRKMRAKHAENPLYFETALFCLLFTFNIINFSTSILLSHRNRYYWQTYWYWASVKRAERSWVFGCHIYARKGFWIAYAKTTHTMTIQDKGCKCFWCGKYLGNKFWRLYWGAFAPIAPPLQLRHCQTFAVYDN